jgi:hypothetical protein
MGYPNNSKFFNLKKSDWDKVEAISQGVQSVYSLTNELLELGIDEYIKKPFEIKNKKNSGMKVYKVLSVKEDIYNKIKPYKRTHGYFISEFCSYLIDKGIELYNKKEKA